MKTDKIQYQDKENLKAYHFILYQNPNFEPISSRIPLSPIDSIVPEPVGNGSKMEKTKLHL